MANVVRQLCLLLFRYSLEDTFWRHGCVYPAIFYLFFFKETVIMFILLPSPALFTSFGVAR